jgi:hypothetical protein
LLTSGGKKYCKSTERLKRREGGQKVFHFSKSFGGVKTEIVGEGF